MITDETTLPSRSVQAEPRPRAVFSTQDFEVMRAALGRYMQSDDVRASEGFNRVSSLYHRLGRVS